MGRKGTRRNQPEAPPIRDWRETWDEEELTRLEAFECATIDPPVWADLEAMEILGITTYVARLLGDMGLGRLHCLSQPAYVEPTKHFAASLRIERTARAAVQRLKMSFKLYGDEYQFDVDDVNTALGFKRGISEAYDRMVDPGYFWGMIASTNWDVASAKNIDIRNPVIRYVARLVANTLTARKDPGKVKMIELAHLYRGLGNYLGVSDTFGHTVSNGAVFVQELVTLRDRLAKKKGNSINFGGMLTPLFRHLRIDLFEFEEVKKRIRNSRDRYPRPPRDDEHDDVDPNEEIDALGDEPPLPPLPWTDREERLCELHWYQSSVIDIFYRAFKSVSKKMRDISKEMVEMRNEMSCIRNAAKDTGRHPPPQPARSGRTCPSNQPAHSRVTSSARSGFDS